VSADLLVDTDMSVEEIAKWLDYSDRSKHTKAFQKLFGMTPTQDRKANGRPDGIGTPRASGEIDVRQLVTRVSGEEPEKERGRDNSSSFLEGATTFRLRPIGLALRARPRRLLKVELHLLNRRGFPLLEDEGTDKITRCG
jgi:hypothetical protein